MTRRQQAQHVAERLLGSGIWWRTIDRNHMCHDTFWHWDGSRSWFTSKAAGWVFNTSEFTPASMDAAPVEYERVPDPRFME